MPKDKAVSTAAADIAKADQAIARSEDEREQLEAEREEIAFAAVIEKDAAAVERLDVICHRLLEIGEATASATAARKTAVRRHQMAIVAADTARNRAAAEAAVQEFEQVFVPLGHRMDALAAEMSETARRWEDSLRRCHGHGLTAPSGALFAVNAAIALATAFAGDRILGGQITRVAPGDRQSFGALCKTWQLTARNWARQRGVHVDRGAEVDRADIEEEAAQ